MTTKRPVYLIELQADDDDTPVQIRLRAALKHLLRSWGLRCLSIREEQTPTPEKEEIHRE